MSEGLKGSSSWALIDDWAGEAEEAVWVISRGGRLFPFRPYHTSEVKQHTSSKEPVYFGRLSGMLEKARFNPIQDT